MHDATITLRNADVKHGVYRHRKERYIANFVIKALNFDK